MGMTREEFESAVTACGYQRPTCAEIYRHLAAETASFSRDELAMFLAQLIHESGGFQYREELAFVSRPNHGAYVDDVGLPGKDYHGRGFIQLTWGANYREASEALGMGDRLLINPELVAEDTRIAVLVSVWYWTARVRPEIVGKEKQFGATTRAINGAIECAGGFNQRAFSRYQNYLKIADIMGIKDKASECGCYN